jgi:hypothetical protein
MIAMALFGVGQPVPKHQGSTDQHHEIRQNAAAPSVSVVGQPSPEAEESRPDNKAKNTWEKGFAPESWPNWVLAFVGIGGIFVAVKTLRKIERQTKATEDAAVAANRNIEIIVSKERARIRIESADLDFEQGHGKIIFTVIAYGGTEGFIVESYMNTSITRSADEGRDLDVGVSASLPEVLIPHSPVQRWIPLEKEEIRHVTEGPTAFVHLRVCVRYEDVFHKATQWETESRYTWRVSIFNDGALGWSEWTHSNKEKENKRN